MSDNLDFMAIFGGEGSLDLGSGGEDFDALFAEKESAAPQSPEEKAPETAEAAQPEEAPVEAPEPEQSKEDANAPEEEKPETPPEPAAAPEKKPAAPKAAVKPPVPAANPFEAAMRQVEEKITEDLAGELLTKPPVFQFGGVTEEIEDREKTFEQLRKEKSDDFPELEDGKRVSWTMEYGKISKTIPKPKDSVIYAAKAEIERSEAFRERAFIPAFPSSPLNLFSRSSDSSARICGRGPRTEKGAAFLHPRCVSPCHCFVGEENLSKMFENTFEIVVQFLL